jgi:hypothetical protein
MKWNVYYYDINRKKMHVFNIFEHSSFVRYVKLAIKKHKNKKDFAEQLKSELMYFFWAKSEWEIIISPWVGGDREKDAVKIDVYHQVMNNFDAFLDYVWLNKEELLKVE